MRGRSPGRMFRMRPPMRLYKPFMWWPRLFLMGAFMYYVFGTNTYKVRKNDVTVIEAETGKKSSDLTEEEQVAAIHKLGLKKLEVSDEEKQRREQA